MAQRSTGEIALPAIAEQSSSFLPAGGWTESILHNFGGFAGSFDGAYPYGGVVIDAAGNLYGTTDAGGPGLCSGISGCGVVFELSSSGNEWEESILYDFQPGSTGSRSMSPLILDPAGNLYGPTSAGGSPACDCGVVFELSPAGSGAWNETVIHTFTRSQPGGGYLMMDAAGDIYGVEGGGTYGKGTAYELVPGSGGRWTETVLHNFGSGNDGAAPSTPLLLDSAGNLYGGTDAGGFTASSACELQGCGTVFELAVSAGSVRN